jgi:glycosyltransferase involved in cell wall biosynthesis
MEKDYLIAIVTATFNRKELLSRLYQSLATQSVKNFSWIIVDDGSVDGTKEYVQSIENSKIDIRYMYIYNGGKCRALNRVFEKYTGFHLYVIVDSDDYFVPDALEQIQNTMLKYQDNNDVGAIFFRYINEKTQSIISGRKPYPDDSIIISRLDHDKNYGKYDGCVAYYNRAVEKYRYPEFEGEKYVGPIVLQMLMEPEFKMVFTTTVVGVAEYQQNGISKTGRKLRLQNPLGMIFYCALLQQSSSTWIKFKYGVIAQAYRRLRKISSEKLEEADISKKAFPKFAYLPGCFLAFYWRHKYVIVQNEDL